MFYPQKDCRIRSVAYVEHLASPLYKYNSDHIDYDIGSPLCLKCPYGDLDLICILIRSRGQQGQKQLWPLYTLLVKLGS